MSYVLVTADFPDVTSEQRTAIEKCLKEKKWTKVECVGRDISTTWYAKFKDSVSGSDAIKVSKTDFEECYKQATKKHKTKPPLVIHVGQHKPSVFNCD